MYLGDWVILHFRAQELSELRLAFQLDAYPLSYSRPKIVYLFNCLLAETCDDLTRDYHHYDVLLLCRGCVSNKQIR